MSTEGRGTLPPIPQKTLWCVVSAQTVKSASFFLAYGLRNFGVSIMRGRFCDGDHRNGFAPLILDRGREFFNTRERQFFPLLKGEMA